MSIDVNEFAKIFLAKRELSCSIYLTDEDPCAICRDESRDQSTILIVEDSRMSQPWKKYLKKYHGLCMSCMAIY